MSSMNRLRRRTLRWHRYAVKTVWNPRHTPPTWSPRPILSGHQRAWDRQEWERGRRQDVISRRWWPK